MDKTNRKFMKLTDTDQKIIDAVIRKADRICPGSLALIGVYGSVCTGDIHDKSDLDLLILINDDAGWQLARGFILDDKEVGYDMYCTSWAMLEEEADCRHAHLAKLMDSELVYVADQAAVERLGKLRKRAEEILKSDQRFARVDDMLIHAKAACADALMAEAIAEARVYASDCVNFLLDAVMMENGQYFHRGVKRTFEELEGLSVPKHFAQMICDVIVSEEIVGLKRKLTKLLQSVALFCGHAREKEKPSPDNISGTYEEMFSNWRNKMPEAAVNRDLFSSFMNLASLQLMIGDIARDVAIAEFGVMDRFDPVDLGRNVEVFDEALHRYLREYRKIGIAPERYEDVEAFVEAYL